MKKGINAIVILYNGIPMDSSDSVVATQIAGLIVSSGFADDISDITIVAKDTDALTRAAIRECTSDAPEVKVINLKQDEEDELLMGSIILLSTLFKESLIQGRKTRNYAAFMRDLLLNLKDEKVHRAIEVIATRRNAAKKNILSDHYLTPGAMEVITDVYRSTL